LSTDPPQPVALPLPAQPRSPAGGTVPLPFDGPQPTLHADGTWTWDDPFDLDRNPRLRRLRGFQSAYLPDPRDIAIWLPPTYGTDPSRRFPVLYLHDGQNLFDPRTSYVPGRTWCAHSTADRLARESLIEPVILVGVNNTGHQRMVEYTPSRDWRHGGGKGPLYARLLVDELKPLVDAQLRTATGPAHTGLAGSSLGGLISLAIGLDYPQVFGKLGVLSPSVWWNRRDILTRIGPEDSPRPRILPPFRRHEPAQRREPSFSVDRPRPRIWLDMGMSEGLRHLRDTDLLHQRLLTRGWQDGVDLAYLVVPGGVHDEDAWARRFHRVLQWLFPLQTAR
jgi:predicted alpha/beta superfamily hydrolase